MHATPVLYGRTEPPGRLTLQHQDPNLEYHRASSPFTAVKRIPTGILYPFGSRPRVGLSAKPRGCSSTMRSVCAQPCSFGLEQNLLAASIPAPGLPTLRVASPGVLSLSPHMAVPVSRPFSLRLLDSRGPFFSRLAAVVPRLAKVSKLPLLVSVEQNPLAALPSSTRFPASQFPEPAASHYQGTRQLLSPCGSRGCAGPRLDFDTAEALRRTLVCTLPLATFARQHYRF